MFVPFVHSELQTHKGPFWFRILISHLVRDPLELPQVPGPLGVPGPHFEKQRVHEMDGVLM